MKSKLIVIVVAMGLVFASGAAGATWSAPVNLSADGQDARVPQVAGSADGSKLTSVWEQWGSGNSIIQASTSTDYGATWSNPIDLSDPGQDARGPQVTCSADGSTLTSVWYRWDGSHWIIQASTSKDSGAAWSTPVNLSDDEYYGRWPRLTGSADGSKLTVVWLLFNGSHDIVQASSSATSGDTWSSPPVNLSEAGQNAEIPSVTCSADGSKLIAVWSRYNGSKWIIQFRTSNTSGSAWSPSPINLFADGQDAREPRVTGSTDGDKLAVVWSDGNNSNWIIQASTSPDYGASWSSPLNVSTGGQDVRPRYQVTCSADGTKLTSVWSHYDGSDFFIQASTSTNSGASWSTPVNISKPGQSDNSPQVTCSADGSKLTSVWSRDNGSHMIIQASTSINSGESWSAAVNLSAYDQDAIDPQMTGSADGSKLASVWSHYEGSDKIIQASTTPPIAPTPAGMFYVIPNREGGGAVIYLE